MFTLQELTEQDVLGLSQAASEPDWLRDRRLEAFKAFSDLEWPDRQQEDWRYTDPRRFDVSRPVLMSAGEATPVAVGITAVVERAGGRARIVDGSVVEAAPSEEASDLGIVVTDFATAARDHADVLRDALGSAVGTADKFEAAALAAFTSGVLVYVPADVEHADPIMVTIQSATAGLMVTRVLVVLGAHAKATVFVDHTGDGESTVVEAVEVIVGEGAKANVVTAQDWGDRVDHVGSHRGLVCDNGDYRHLEVTLGGRTVYLRPDVKLDHPGANGELLGVYFATEGQRVEHRSLIHHNASKTTSKLIYKGALQGDSRTTFFGNIRIEPHARATASDQTNRNLILTDKARADSIPFLEILNSDVVRCGHHSSVGQVDELQLFYLQSRGISREEAARLLVFGFFAEVLDRVKLPGVSEVVLGEIEREIRTGPAALDPRRG